jgi:Ser/Thr protein kinase RdoA (MazF antagonist)
MGRTRHQITKTQQAETSRPLDGVFEEVARAFFPDLRRLSPVGNGELARVERGEEAWAMRRWRPGTTAGQIRFVHDLLRAGRAAGVEVVPEVATTTAGEAIVQREGRFFDAQRWLPGASRARQAPERGPIGEHVNLPGTLPTAVQHSLIETVARLHLAGEPLAQARGAPTLTLAAMIRAVEGGWERARARLRPAAPHRPAIQRWIRAGERGLRVAAHDLLAHPEIAQRSRVVGHHDLWAAHVLVARQESGAVRLTGIVDWVDASAGSPLLDLAQIVGHCGGWSADRAEAAIAAYSTVARLEPDERRLLPAVATLDLIGEAAWLLSVAYGDPERGEAPSSALRDGIEELVESLERAVEVAALGDRPRKPPVRRWEYREPRRAAGPPSGDDQSPRVPKGRSTSRKGEKSTGPARSRRAPASRD